MIQQWARAWFVTAIGFLLAAMGTSCALAQLPAATNPALHPVDDIIPEHGKYTASYVSDWSRLPTADVMARKDVSTFAFKEVIGEEARIEWRNQDVVHIKDLALKVQWKQPKAAKYETSLLFVENAKEVVIENLAIMCMDRDYRTFNTIMIEGADRVTVRNLYLAGPVQGHHLRIEGCKDVLVENVEVAGIDFDGKGKCRVGGGIWINNGDTSPKYGVENGIWAKHPRLPGWQVIQHCYFHDGTEDDGTGRNQDAVLIHSPSHGIIFNCVVENWLRPMMDSSFDLGFRRHDPEFQDRFFRVERNIFRNTTFLKTPAKAPGPNVLLFANNLFINTQLGDYHGFGNDVHYIHNTYIFDLEKAAPSLRELARRGSEGYASLWQYNGRTFLTNSLVYRPSGRFVMFYSNNSGEPDKYRHFYPDHNAYLLPATETSWLRTAGDGLKYKAMSDWSAGMQRDAASRMISPRAGIFANYAGDDYRLSEEDAASLAGIADSSVLKPTDSRMKVDRDFNGLRRSEQKILVPGAFVAAQTALRANR